MRDAPCSGRRTASPAPARHDRDPLPPSLSAPAGHGDLGRVRRHDPRVPADDPAGGHLRRPELSRVSVAARPASVAAQALAAIATLVLLLVLVMAPLLAVLGAGANEALRVTETIRPRLEQLVDQPGEFDRRLRALPGYDRIEPYRAQILTKAGELVGSTSAFLFAALSATTRATAVFIFHFVVLLYTMFFFLIGRSGPAPRRSRVPAAHRGRQATHAREVRVGHARDAQGHDPDRRGSGPAWQVWRSGPWVSTGRSSGGR